MENKKTKKVATVEKADAVNIKKTAQAKPAIEKKAKAEPVAKVATDVVKPVKVAASSKAKHAVKAFIKIKQIASGYGRVHKQTASLKGLGLTKISQIVEREDTPAVRGMVNRVKHLVEIVKD